MSPFQALGLQAAVLLAVVSGQVALARRARPMGAVALAVLTVLAMAAVAFEMFRRFSGLAELPGFLVRPLLLASASSTGVVLIGTTSAALWLARRDSKPRPLMHWAITALAGLLMYPVAIQTNARLGFDMVNAVDDGTGPRAVIHPTPEERMARARTLPVCSIRALEPRREPAWRWQTVRPIAARLPMPAQMHDEPDEVPDDPGIQQWGLERWGNIVLQLDGDAQQSTGFFIGGGARTVIEPPCALRIGSSLVPVRRTASSVRRRGASAADSMFTATTDVPVALPDTQLGVGITARTRAGRDTLLSILAAIQFIGREQAR